MRFTPSMITLTLILAVLLGLMVSRGFWRAESPASSAARRVKDRAVSARLVAIGDLERFGQDDPRAALPALSGVLEDRVAEVRTAGALALVLVLRSSGQNGVAHAEARGAVASLFGKLKDSDVRVRAAVVQSLAMSATLWEGPASVVDRVRVRDVLMEAAADPEAEVRLSAVRGLGAVAPRISTEPPAVLLPALDDASESVRTAAAESLVSFPGGVAGWFPVCIRSFEAARPENRPAYALVVSRVRPRAFGRDAVDALASALASPDDEIRCLAATALAAFGEHSALHGHVDRPDAAIPALVAAAARPGRAQFQRPGSVATHRLELKPNGELGWVPGTPPGSESDPALRAAWALTCILPSSPVVYQPPELDSKSRSVLIEVLTSGAPDVRAAVAIALGRLRPDPAVVPVLGKAIRDRDATVRAAALRAVHDLADRMSFAPPAEFDAALDDESPQVRYWAAGSLGHIQRGVEPYIPRLLQHAEADPDREVRDVCAFEVRDFVRPSAVSAGVVHVLVERLDSPSAEVQDAACGLLARLGRLSDPALPRLRALARSASAASSKAASEALIKLGAADRPGM